MVRTQIYIDDGQKAALDRLSAEKRTTVSGLIRQAVNQIPRKKLLMILRRLWTVALGSGVIDTDLVNPLNMSERYVANGMRGTKGSN